MTDFVNLWVHLSATPLFGLTATLLWGQPGVSVSPLRPLLGPMGEASWREGGFRLQPDRPDAVTR